MAKETPKQYRFIGSHAEVLANGHPVEPGEFVDLTDEDIRDPHNEMLAAEGFLIGTDDSAEHQVSLADRRVTSRSEPGDHAIGEESDKP